MKKFLLIIALVLSLQNNAQTPSQDQNYILTVSYQKGYIKGQEQNALISEKIVGVTYFDGLGRPMQNVAVRAGGANQDIITYIDYDAFGRQAKDYLPYAAVSNGGAIRTGALSATNSFYDTAKYDLDFPGMTTLTINPYSEKQFEASPLNRVMQQAAPGASWKLGTGHEIKFNYQTNVAGEVKLYGATAIWNATSGLYNTSLVNGTGTVFYAANQLYKTVTYDENSAAIPTETDGSTVEFKNKQGQVVLKRTYNAGAKHDTYYVYDDYGNLTYVIPPKVEVSITTAILDELCYQYKYDSRNRLVEKKIPGKQWEFIVYDKLDRPIATGPAFSPFTSPTGNGWLITKYDAFDRPIITAWLPSTTVTSAGRKTLQDARNAELTNFSETKIATTSDTTINGVAFRYTNAVYPVSGYHVLSVNYFDDYNFPNAPTIPSEVELQTVFYNTTVKPKGLSTGTWTRVLETSTLYKNEVAYTLYDYKARPIRSYSQNYLGGYTYVDSKLDFTGKPEYTLTKHKLLGSSVELTTREDFVYSDQGRLLTQTHQINTGAKQLITKNDYDELGQLISKKVGGADITGATGLQTVNYAYNIRGWLKQINDPNILGTDLFGFKINYNTVSHHSPNTNKELYNGNISETEWKTQNDNVLRWYKYEYDKLNRITSGIDNTTDTRYSLSIVAYDKNGNIANLTRRGQTNIGATAFGVMDQLTYDYALNSNKLMKVSDAATIDSFGFKDDALNTASDFVDDYTYDANGNMLKDLNKAMTSNILYNHLNLPTNVTFASGNISYIYDAAGVKLEKVVTEGIAITRTKYVGNFIYEKIGTAADVLKFFSTAEGYVEPNGSAFNYVYQYKDHLGNIRLSYKDISLTNTPSLQIVEENNYYPFGLKHQGYNTAINGTHHKYMFGGKEFDESFQTLNTYDFGARNYDPALGRWMNLDPLAEKFYVLSPYNYVANSPLVLSDPDGRDISFSYQRDDDGNITGITLTVRGKIINNSSNRLSEKQLQKSRDKILNGLKNIKVEGTDGISVNFNGNIEVASSESDIQKSDHVFRIVDDISEIEGSGGGANAVGYAPIGQNVIYLEDGFSSNTAAHEVGHSAGFKHINESRQSDFMPDAVDYFRSLLRNPYKNEVNHWQSGAYIEQIYKNIYNDNSFSGNLMHRGVTRNASGELINNPSRGNKVTGSQVSTIIHNIKNGKINKGKQN